MFIEYSEGLKKFFRYLFFLFLSTFPFLLYEGFLFNATSSRSLNIILLTQVASLIIGLYICFEKKGVKFIKSPVTWSLSIFLFFLLLSSVLGSDLSSSFWSKITRTTGLFYFFHIGILYFLFNSIFDNKKDIINFIKVFVVSAAIFSIASSLSNDGFGLIFTNRAWQGFTLGNSTFAGMFIVPAFILSMYILLSENIIVNKWIKYLLPLSLIFNPYIINFNLFKGSNFYGFSSIIGSSQASSIVILVSIFAVYTVYLINKIKKDKVRYIFFISLIFLSSVILFLGSKSLITKGGIIQDIYLSGSSQARPLVWDLSKNAIKEKPLLGWGVDNFDISYQKYYDNKVLELKNGGEAWFDRAHNVFIDQLIEVGYLGLLAYLIVLISIFYCLSYVFLKSKDPDYKLLSGILTVYFILHIVEIQTSFDTSISFLLMLFLVSIITTMFFSTRKNITTNHQSVNIKSLYIGIFLVCSSLYLFFVGTINIIRTQKANSEVRTVGSSLKRLEIYPILFKTKIDKPSFLWSTSNDIQRGVSLETSVLDDEYQKNLLKEEVISIISYYEAYLKEDTKNYRLMLNLADMYIYQSLFGVDSLDKAHDILDRAVIQVPNSPQSYWMKSVAYLYQGKFDLAKEFAKRAYDLNPDIEESQRLMDYIDNSIKDFPVIDLYSFKQI